MNRLERIQLLERCAAVEAQNTALKEAVSALEARIVALEERPRIGRPPKVKEDGQSPN
jgi:hypothetical protein